MRHPEGEEGELERWKEGMQLNNGTEHEMHKKWSEEDYTKFACDTLVGTQYKFVCTAP